MIRIVDTLNAPTTSADLLTLSEQIFQPSGSLQLHLALEHRPQQHAMAIAVTQALDANAPLLFEAGTGVGKSLAYLIPGIIQSLDQSCPFIVSTHTSYPLNSYKSPFNFKRLQQTREKLNKISLKNDTTSNSSTRPRNGFFSEFLEKSD